MNDTRPLVMHVVYSFDVGGLENGVVNLINRLPEAQFRHVIVALTRCAPEFCKRIVRADVEFISLNKPPGHGVQLYPRLLRLFREYRPAIVHSRNLAALEAALPARLAGVGVRVHGEHGWDVSDPHGERRKYQLIRRAYRPFVSHYIALSGELAGYLKQRVGVAAPRISRICNGVDTQRFVPAEGRQPLAGSPFNAPDLIVIGTVGRLQAVKDQLNLVRAFALLLEQGRGAADRLRLLIAGDGPLRGEIEAEILRCGITKRVWLAGERADVADVMRSLDVFVLPSQSEGISNTILEAMASGLPVVATDTGGNGELIVDGETGLLARPRDSQALAAAIARYAGNRALARAHGRAGRVRAEREFSLEVMVDRYASLYTRLLQGGLVEAA